MAHRIEIGLKEGIRDALGEKIKRRIVEHLCIPVDRVRTVDVYTLDGQLVHAKVVYEEALRSLPRGIYLINGRKVIKQ